MDKEFLTPLEIANILKIKKNTVYEMIKRGDINATRVGKQLRISKSDFANYLNISNTTNFNSPSEITSSKLEFQKRITDSILVLCGQDIILDRICDLANQVSNSYHVVRSHMGSYNGLFALYNEQVQIATAHLWDRETDSYNLTYISKVLPGFPCAVYHMANRVQGFYVKTGNPKRINNFNDLSRTDIVFTNREKGCGTRVLLDQKLISLSIQTSKVIGYDTVVTSHLSAATMVAKGDSDYALGNERTSLQLANISFVPLQVESYDIVIPLTYIDHPLAQTIINILQSSDFKNEIQLMGGYDTNEMGTKLM